MSRNKNRVTNLQQLQAQATPAPQEAATRNLAAPQEEASWTHKFQNYREHGEAQMLLKPSHPLCPL